MVIVAGFGLAEIEIAGQRRFKSLAPRACRMKRLHDEAA